MTEEHVIRSTTTPATTRSLVDDLRGLGVATGDVLIVHASLSAIGYVVGGAQAVIDALQEVVGADGTLTMPAHSSDWSDPADWQHPPVPETWWATMRDAMPAFDAHATPLREMGAIAETLLRLPSTRRSGHPRLSHMANGAHAVRITERHPLAEGFGDESPLAQLYDLDAKVLLIGVSHANNTSIHLAEWRAEWAGKRRTPQGSPMIVGGVRQWVTYDEIETDNADFGEVGAAFGSVDGERTGSIGEAVCRLMSQRALVDFATTWFGRHRNG